MLSFYVYSKLQLKVNQMERTTFISFASAKTESDAIFEAKRKLGSKYSKVGIVKPGHPQLGMSLWGS